MKHACQAVTLAAGSFSCTQRNDWPAVMVRLCMQEVHLHRESQLGGNKKSGKCRLHASVSWLAAALDLITIDLPHKHNIVVDTCHACLQDGAPATCSSLIWPRTSSQAGCHLPGWTQQQGHTCSCSTSTWQKTCSAAAFRQVSCYNSCLVHVDMRHQNTLQQSAAAEGCTAASLLGVLLHIHTR